MKENPLFVDSTKTRGDNINASFELAKLLIRDNERIILKVDEEPQGRQHEVQMRLKEDLFVTKIFLQHKNKIRYQFAILNETKVIACSPIFEGIVNYLTENTWDVADNLKLIFDKKSAPEAKNNKVYEQFQENKTLLGNLIKQWGL